MLISGLTVVIILSLARVAPIFTPSPYVHLLSSPALLV